MPDEIVLKTTINGEPARLLVPANRSLLDMLREDLGLTGSKHGCDVGDCGACTVLLDGQPRLSCITLAAEADGRAVRTIEGMAEGGLLHPIQEALHRHVGAQCGYCTPGIVMALVPLVDDPDHPADDETLKEVLGANICRCTGYTRILSAAREVLAGGDRQRGRAAGARDPSDGGRR